MLPEWSAHDRCLLPQLLPGHGNRWSALISQYTGFLGCEIDLEKNKAAVGVEAVISTPESKVTALVVPTNEELAIARETVRLVNA